MVQLDLTQQQVNHLIALCSNGRLNEALREAKLLSQNHPNVLFLHNVIGVCYAGLDQPESAMISFKKALKINPNDAEILNNLGKVLNDLGRVDEALANFKSALEINPNYAQAFCNLGNAYCDLNQFDKGITSYKKALNISPDYAKVHYYLSNLITYKRNDDSIEFLENLYSKLKPGNCDRTYICFALAKAYDDLGEYEKSFDYLKTGNASRKNELIYTIDCEKEQIIKIKAIFSDAFPPHDVMPVKKQNSLKPIFIVGMPRSGTTLVEQILASHTLVHGAGELQEMSNLVMPMLNNKITRSDIEALQNNYLNMIGSLNVTEKYITDKMPLNFKWIGFIFSSFLTRK